MAAVSENFGNLLEPGLRKIFVDVYREKPQMMDMLYNVQPSSESYEKDSSVGSFGTVPKFTGTVAYDDIYQGYDKTYTHDQYAKGFKIERTLFDDDLNHCETTTYNNRGHNLAICENEPKDLFTDKVITGGIYEPIRRKDFWRWN